MAFFVSDAFSFLFLSLLILSFLSLPCFSLSTVSVSETSDQNLICALNNRSSLQCSSFPKGSIRLPMTDNIRTLKFSGVVSGNGFVCALWSPSGSNNSLVLCWRFSVSSTNLSYKRIYQGPQLEELQAGTSRICGLIRGSRRLICWQPKSQPPETFQNFSTLAIGENFLCGLSPPPGRITCEGNGISPAPTRNNFTAIAAGTRQACAITIDNELVCWGQASGVRGKFSALALGENRGCALRTSNGRVVCWGSSNNFSLPRRLQNTHFSSIEAKGRIFCGVATENYTLYCWGNENFESGIFIPFQEAVLPGPCRREYECPCGPMLGSASLCGRGFMICQVCRPDESPRTPPGSPEPPPGHNSDNKTWNTRNVAFLVVGCFGTFTLLLAIGFFVFKYCRNRCVCQVHDSGRLDETGQTREEPKLEKRLSQLASLGNTSQLKEFSLDELARATDGFSIQYKIGFGSFGSVYRAVLSDGRHVAIKRAEVTNPSSYGISRHNRRDDRDKDTAFVNELESLSRLNHKNLVRLLGFYEDLEERVLVYEYVDNGSLGDHLHNPKYYPPPWQARIKIALDAARGIQYLHDYAVPPVIHRDIKSSNILLDTMWTAKVSDFGLSLMGPTDDDVSHLSLRAAGTLGYIDPEYYRLQQLTTKSDVYSFGVVLLELLSGHKAIHKNEDENPRNVIEYVVPYILQDEVHRVLDQRVPPPTPYEIEAVAHVGYVAADCVMPVGRERPSMAEVVSSLERALAACLVAPESLSRSTATQSSNP